MLQIKSIQHATHNRPQETKLIDKILTNSSDAHDLLHYKNKWEIKQMRDPAASII